MGSVWRCGGVAVWPGPNHVFAWSQIVYDLIDAELLINILFSMYFCFHSVACLCLLLVIAVDSANEHWRELLVHRQRWSIYFTVHCIVHQQCISISVSWRINCVYTVMTNMHAFIDRLNGWKSIQISKMCIFFCFSINLYHCFGHIPYPIKKKHHHRCSASTISEIYRPMFHYIKLPQHCHTHLSQTRSLCGDIIICRYIINATNHNIDMKTIQ